MKDFKDIKTNDVYSTLSIGNSRQGQQPEVTEEERAARLANMQTQGRKGCKSPRVNLALTPDNHKFVKTMARASGHTMTQFINLVLAAYQREHPEILEKANDFLNVINSGQFSNLLDPEK